MKDKRISRRDFLRKTTMAGAGIGLSGLAGSRLFGAQMGRETAQAPPAEYASMIGVPYPRHDQVRVGVIGIGSRGTGLLRDLLAIDHVQVNALCDIVESKVVRGQEMVEKAGQPKPAGYSAGDTDFMNLNEREDLDLVYIATPWRWHVPMAVHALDHGKHVGTEVPAATTLADCWKLVNASERNRKHCTMLENVCYGYSEMMVLNMVRDGAFGELTHGEAAYIHDLRGLLCADYSEGLWRRFHHVKRNGNLYPTHGLGPVAQYMDINRGDRFETLVSLSSHEKGLSAYVKAHVPPEDPKRQEKYLCGDMNTSVIKTALGRTIMLQHDTISPRPYSRINLISGTKGTFRGYPDRIFIDGQETHDWQPVEPFQEKYEHPLWKRVGELARKLGGHGGMDFIMSYRLIQCMLEGLPPDMDVYDGAAWSAPGPLSEISVANGGARVEFPDFTRGRWREKR
jgi:predicted dehydrogenase